ncbi:hypothetical protein OPV22_034682 [Ensete ventricosum]|uniref:Uncharacterized protein n=1 Tax=Ensete ventricosum TaxID=4639 RepID=A0AAV8P261_ENSVE|nr:hypothetical protein OPV22_034682 [Ensete ventricosum]
MIDLYRILTRTPKPSHLARGPPRLEIIRCSITSCSLLLFDLDMEASCRSENSGAAALRGGVPRGGDCLGRGKVSPLASSSGSLFNWSTGPLWTPGRGKHEAVPENMDDNSIKLEFSFWLGVDPHRLLGCLV